MKGDDSGGMSETDEISQRRGATVIAHRSPRGKRSPETEINSNFGFYSFNKPLQKMHEVFLIYFITVGWRGIFCILGSRSRCRLFGFVRPCRQVFFGRQHVDS